MPFFARKISVSRVVNGWSLSAVFFIARDFIRSFRKLIRSNFISSGYVKSVMCERASTLATFSGNYVFFHSFLRRCCAGFISHCPMASQSAEQRSHISELIALVM